MRAADTFKELLKIVYAPALREHGYLKRGQTFYIQRANLGLINFQKSVKTNAAEIVFTVNIGIASARLIRFFAPARGNTRPQITDCHWRERLGNLLPDSRDRWWTIDSETDVWHLGKEMRDYVCTLGIPLINTFMQDEALRDLWLSGRSPGLTDFQRLLNLSVLLNTLGPQQALETVIKELQRITQGTPRATVVEHHLQKLLLGRSK